MILIRDAIESAIWIEINGTVPGHLLRDPFDVTYRVRISGFSKIDLHSLGEYDGFLDWQANFKEKIGLDANVWKIDLDVVNMEKYEIYDGWIKETLRLQDQDGYKFRLCDDSWLNRGSPYAHESGLSNLACMKFPPKIKKTGAFSIELPEFVDDLYVSAHIGTVREI